MKDITVKIGKAIREGKYLSISYQNQNGENTAFWISILDISANDEIQVNMFNVTKDDPILNKKIYISRIKSAEVLRFSHYEVPEQLVRKLDHDESLLVYDFFRYDDDILNYYLECYRANRDPFLYKAHLIPGLDLAELSRNTPYPLSAEQQKRLIKEIYHNDYKTFYEYQLALSEFSIDLGSNRKFVIAFRKLEFDPVEQTLHLGKVTQFNAHFYFENAKHSLSYYTDLSPKDFEAIYTTNGKEEAIKLISDNFRRGEFVNTRPEVVVLGYQQIDISKVYDCIAADQRSGKLPTPLKAFFQNLSLLDRKKRSEPNIVLYDRNVNIDQLRTIYNALKYPVTYVQGPPGTGKTQTLLNLVVNCLVNEKTLLISSNNNVPIDGIRDKLVLGKYRDQDIRLPVIRLGNRQYVAQALKIIRELFAFETKDVPKEELLFNLKERSKEKNKLLLEKLKHYEERIDLYQNLEFVNGLLAKGSNYLLDKEKQKLQEKLDQIPLIQNDDLDNLFEVIKGNHQLLQFFYFESLRYLKRLKSKDFTRLREIVNIDDEPNQVREFNKWISDDANLEKFTKVFPVILSTNLSCSSLGRRFKFDLVAIDEAGQCDLATSLIPISKCQNMVLIGDTNQLKPIVSFDESRNDELMKRFKISEPYNFYHNSILSTYKRIDNISRDILLSFHYRCGKKIIKYSNMRFYENKLNLSKNNRIGEVTLLKVNNVNQKGKNSSIEEALAVIRYVKENQLSDAFIITPFRNQEEVIRYYLRDAQEKGEVDRSVDCGTIHKIQGQENSTIIISVSISRNTTARTYDWVKNNSELINVGVTRARERLVVVADKRAIDILSRKDDDLYALIDYVANNGISKVSESPASKFTIGFSNNSVFEDEFYKTMSHYCTVQGARFERNVKVTDVFPEEINNTLVSKKEFDGVLYEGKVPKVIFEINGGEHYQNRKRIASDKLKMQLVTSKNLKLIFVPNHYVKHYEFIRELLNKIKGGAYQETLFEF